MLQKQGFITMNNAGIKIKVKTGSRLQYLKPVIEHAFKYTNRLYDMKGIPDSWLPTSGKERSFVPILVSGVFNSGMAASSEIKVQRIKNVKGSNTIQTGSLDLIVFSDKNGHKRDAIEVKSSGRVITGTTSAKSIYEKLDAATKQLNEIVTDKHESGKVAIVVHRMLIQLEQDLENKNTKKYDQIIKKAYLNAPKLFQQIYNENKNVLIGQLIFDKPHEVNVSRGRQGIYSSIGLTLVARRQD